MNNPINSIQRCEKCVLPVIYEFSDIKNDSCKFCNSFQKKEMVGLDSLVNDLKLLPNEKVGVTVSGGKDSIYMWGILTNLLGNDRVAAYCYYKPGITNEIAMKNILNANKVLNTKLTIVKDEEAYDRFKNNLKIFLEKPHPAMVRVLLCAGCRYGITERLYKKGYEDGVTKYISGASYLELAPFKEELLASCSENNNVDEGFENLLKNYPELDYSDNLSIIKRDQKYKYKDNSTLKNRLSNNIKYKLFDFDDYVENNPKKIEEYVIKHYNWDKSDRSWHFDCKIEDFKDVFYFGLLG